MWVDRQLLEDELKQALRGKLHIVIQGESGSGKTWLWKKVVGDLGAKSCHANFANAVRLKSIGEELKNAVEREEKSEKTGYSEEKKMEGGLWKFFSVGLKHTWQIVVGRKEPFEACLKALRRKAGRKPAVLVIENLEAIVGASSDHLRDLSNLLLLCDDERYASYDVRLILVGAGVSLRRCLLEMPNSSSVRNRISEISEVGQLPWPSAERLLRNGLVDILGYEVDSGVGPEDEPDDSGDPDPNPNLRPSGAELAWDGIAEHIIWVTDRMPHHLHAYALELSRLAEESNGILSENLLADADQAWVVAGLKDACWVVSEHLGEATAVKDRKNQLLWVLGRVVKRSFTAAEVNAEMRKAFPATTAGVKSGFEGILTQFENAEHPLVTRIGGANEYRFVDPSYRMALRVLLQQELDEKVSVRFRVPE